jgi:hypothetical protein
MRKRTAFKKSRQIEFDGGQNVRGGIAAKLIGRRIHCHCLVESTRWACFIGSIVAKCRANVTALSIRVGEIENVSELFWPACGIR